MNDIGFFYPSESMGGAQLLFARLAIDLRRNLKYSGKLYYFDVKNGFSTNYLKNEGIEFEHIIISENELFNIPTNIILVVPFDYNSLKLIENYGIFDRVKFLFYFIEPHLLLSFFYATTLTTHTSLSVAKIFARIFFARRFRNLGAFLIKSISNQGVLFMDTENTSIPDFFYKLHEKHHLSYLPIPITHVDHRIDSMTNDDKIRIFWVGSIVKQKYYSLSTVILHFINYIKNSTDTFELNIIGEGEYLQYVKRIIRPIEKHVIFHGSISPNSMNDLLKNKCDLLFAMGTSALEGGKYGVPTVLVDILSKVEKNYKYKWLNETTGYSLGCRKKDKKNKHKFNDLIYAILNEELREKVSKDVFEYTQQHDMKQIGSKFWDYLLKCNNLISKQEFAVN